MTRSGSGHVLKASLRTPPFGQAVKHRLSFCRADELVRPSAERQTTLQIEIGKCIGILSLPNVLGYDQYRFPDTHAEIIYEEAGIWRLQLDLYCLRVDRCDVLNPEVHLARVHELWVRLQHVDCEFDVIGGEVDAICPLRSFAQLDCYCLAVRRCTHRFQRATGPACPSPD